jgi:serine/threonine protein kinase
MEKDEKKISEKNINTENNKKEKKIKSKGNNNISTNINNLNSSIKKTNNSTTSSGPKPAIPTNAKKPKKVQKNNKNEKKVTPKLDAINSFNSEDYNILNIIGEGTFSQIFLVEDNKTHEKFALKKMAGTKLEDLEEKKYEFEFIMKLTKEDEKLNLVKIYGIQIKQLDKFNMVLYILMESAKSDWETELKNRHYDKKFYTEEELKNILLGLVQTFSSLQRRGICHRDVKPQNILSFGNGVYKITDFGEAKANKKDYKSNFSQDTSVQTVRGTELYMSPILFNALRQNPGDDLQYNAFKSDVFSLGLCFLLACSLSYKPLYQMRDANNMNTIKDIMEKYIKNRYSKNITELLYTMLQLEEKDRPDFIELESMVKKLFN